MKICVESVPFFLTDGFHVALPEENVFPQISLEQPMAATKRAEPQICANSRKLNKKKTKEI